MVGTTPALSRSLHFELSVQKGRAVVYNLAWAIGVVAKLLGQLDFSWQAAALFLVVANATSLLLIGLYSQGVTRVAGISLRSVSMGLDLLIITWAVALSGGSQSAWYPWYLTNAAAAAFFAGRRALVVVMSADIFAYLALVVLTEGFQPEVLVAVFGKMLILFGAGAYALLAVSRIQEKRRVMTELREVERRRAADLEAALATIADSAGHLHGAGDELGAVSQSLIHRAEDTASRAGTVSAAAATVSDHVNLVATAVEEASAGVREIARDAHEATLVAREAVGLAEETNRTLVQLDSSSSDVSGVIDTISGIAKRTRLLALNASIEAARAGEAGRGFAVVADEVKELADATTSATDDVGTKVRAIQADVEAVVSAIGRIETIIARIHDLQLAISGAVEQHTQTTAEISGSAASAARGGASIADEVTAVAALAEATASAASVVGRAARQLAALAEELEPAAGPGSGGSRHPRTAPGADAEGPPSRRRPVVAPAESHA